MINLVKVIYEAAETEDFSLKTIDPREESFNKETDDALFNEAYKKASISIANANKKHQNLFREFAINVKTIDSETFSSEEFRTEIHSLSISPNIDMNILQFVMDYKNDEVAEKDADSIYNNFNHYMADKCALMNDHIHTLKEKLLGPVITAVVPMRIIGPNLSSIRDKIFRCCDELYDIYVYISNKLRDAKYPFEVELLARMFDLCCRLVSYKVGAYSVAALELQQISLKMNNPITEAATNEENAKKYIDEIDELIDEIRDFYDKFEYKEIITPRKKKETKMYEYVLGALERKYTLRIPIYKVEGVSKDVKDIVEHKFIDKLESITKKYPNFVIMSPSWDEDDDIFIYITLREPFGDKEDRKDRENQVKNESVLTEAPLPKETRDALNVHEFGIPETRSYPLNDETRIRKAIVFFGYCKSENKKTLADNIVRRIIELDLVGKVSITEKHPNKKYFPEWMLDTYNPELKKHGNKYDIFIDGKKVDYGTLKDYSEDESIKVVNEQGLLY